VLLAAGAAEVALRVAGHLYLRRLYTTSFRAMDPRPDDVNVLCLGESSTAGLGVDPSDSYPGQLQAMLREFYDDLRIRTIVPPHVGQNTSQMANRIRDYVELYRPRLVIVMAGYNNEWSLAESHVTRHLDGPAAETWRVRALVLLDGFRLFKLLRYSYLRFVARERSEYMAENTNYVWGHPELARFPPAAWIHELARRHSVAFVRAWREDVEAIARTARAGGSRVLLMTYHLNPSYLPSVEFTSVASELRVPLVRNDEAFQAATRLADARRYLLDDGWHPNRLGYEIIARNAFATIRDDDLLSAAAPPASAPPGPAPPAESERAAGPLGGRLLMGSSRSAHYLGSGWGDPEAGFRWTDGPRAEVFFSLASAEARLLRIRLAPFLVAGRLESQRVELLLNGRSLAVLTLADPAPAEHAVLLPAALLARDNALSLVLPDRRSPSSLGASGDGRELAAAVEWIEMDPLPTAPEDGITLAAPSAQAYLGQGWGAPEAGYRWTDGSVATLFFRSAAPGSGVLRIRLQPFLRPPALARQRVGVELDGTPLGWFALSSAEARELAIPVSGEARERALTLRLPDARSPASLGEAADLRRLGVAVASVALEPFPGIAAGERIDLDSTAAVPHLLRGWSAPEAGCRWARPPKAEFAFRLSAARPGQLRLRARGYAVPEGEQDLRLALRLNGSQIASLRLTRRDPFPTTYAFPLPSDALASDNLVTLEFETDAGHGAEPAGLAVESLELVAASGER
jgi:lysophospholipase L1-like esterase